MGLPSRHFRHAQLASVERAKFSILIRLFKIPLRKFRQASKCDYSLQLDDQIGDRLTAETNMLEIRQKILLPQDQSFQNMRNICGQ